MQPTIDGCVSSCFFGDELSLFFFSYHETPSLARACDVRQPPPRMRCCSETQPSPSARSKGGFLPEASLPSRPVFGAVVSKAASEATRVTAAGARRTHSLARTARSRRLRPVAHGRDVGTGPPCDTHSFTRRTTSHRRTSVLRRPVNVLGPTEYVQRAGNSLSSLSTTKSAHAPPSPLSLRHARPNTHTHTHTHDQTHTHTHTNTKTNRGIR